MTFDPDDLDSTEDFSGVSVIDVKWVEGRDQWVFWKGCSGLTVFEGGKVTKNPILSGKIKLKSGIELYFVGGQVKEKEE